MYKNLGGFRMLKALGRLVLGEDRFVTIEQMYESVTNEPLTARVAPSPKGWKGMEGYIRLASGEVSIFYRTTPGAREGHAETLDLFALDHRGGVVVTFVDDEIVALTHNAIRRDPRNIDDADRQRLWQILLLARQAAHT